MEAKLIKTQEGYTLNDVEGNPIGQTFGKFKGKKLSLKNCQAIERGYDLDELADENVSDIHEANTDFMFKDIYREFFKEGFQKALEILGDKKFSEEDMLKAIEYGTQSVLQAIPGLTSAQSILDAYTQSLQQTEWDVIILEEKDFEGCLILKRL